MLLMSPRELIFVFFNLWSKVVTNVTEIWNLILNDKWNVSRHAQTDLEEEKKKTNVSCLIQVDID